MHVPSCQTQELDILTFGDALARSGGGDAYDETKWIYVPDFYADYRYILGTRGKIPSSASA